MALISLNPYIVRVKQRYSQTDQLVHSFGEQYDLLADVKTVLGGLKLVRSEPDQKAFGIKKVDRKDRTLAGFAESGQYGVEGYLKDVES